MGDYEKKEIQKVIDTHDFNEDSKFRIKIKGHNYDTNNLSVSLEQLKKIQEILGEGE